MAGSKVIILTGAGRGIGLSIAKFLLESAELKLLVAIDVNLSALKEVQEKEKDRLELIEGDVRDRTTSEKAIEITKKHGGKLDSIVLNAAILKPVGPLETTPIDDMKTLFDVNFWALFHTIQLALPQLRESHGNVIMTSSGVSMEPYRAWIPYGSAKAAMNYMCMSLAMEEPEISVICIKPGVVDTGLMQSARYEHKDNMPEDMFNKIKQSFDENLLLRPEQPAATFAKAALEGIPRERNGTFNAWNELFPDIK